MNQFLTCKGCSTPVGETTSRPVGEWRFCDACFEALMLKQNAPEPDPEPAPQFLPELKAEPDAEPEPMLAPIVFESSTAPKTVCRVCERPSVTGEYIDVAGLKVCTMCYGQMMPNTPKEVEPEEPAPPPEPIVKELVGVRNMKCVGCARPITLRGAKQRDEDFYCPDCFSRLPPEDNAEASPGPPEPSRANILTTGSSFPATAPAPLKCDACARTISVAVEPESGFLICEACRQVDIGDAIKLAKHHHKMRLAAMVSTLPISKN